MASRLAASTITISPSASFDLRRTVYSHGWSSLPPFRVNQKDETLSILLRLDRGTLVDCAIGSSGKRLVVSTRSRKPVTSIHKSRIRAIVTQCLRLDEDLSEFYKQAKRHSRFRWITRSGAGRMLRAQTVFEDVVKMMCTTNCSWSLTTILVSNFVNKLGEPFDDTQSAFPTPEAIAGVSESFLRKKIHAGYRSPYLIVFAQRVAKKELDVEAWRTSPKPTDELYDEILGIKGMGPYAAGNLLRLLGRYNHLALDSWVRSEYAKLHHNGRKISDRTIERAYKEYGEWRGLFFWLEMTRSWFDKKLPEW